MAAKKKSKTAKKPAKKSKVSKKAVSKKTSSKTTKKVSSKKKPVKKSKKKAPAKKAPAKKKVPAKKAPAKKVVKKKTPAKKTPAKKKATAAKKPAARKSISFTKPVIRTGPSIAPRPSAHLYPAHKIKPLSKTKVKAKKLTKKELATYKDLLLKFRDRVIDEISFLANDNLNRNAKESSGDLSSYSFHMADQGTDNYDREFAASLLNNEHDVLYEIEEALRRIEQGTYGICEQSEQPIERERLKVLPFARYCVAVQSEMERGKPRHQPFRRTSIQGSDSSAS